MESGSSINYYFNYFFLSLIPLSIATLTFFYLNKIKEQHHQARTLPADRG
jgi:hypothetical protein